jgi:hypothetical protein
MKNSKKVSAPVATNNFDTFILYISQLAENEKNILSDEWVGPEGQPSPDPVLAALGSAVWSTLGVHKGKGFEARALKMAKQAGSADPAKSLAEFIKIYGPMASGAAPVVAVEKPKKAAKKAAPVVEVPSYEAIINILAPTVENNDPFEIELFQEIEQKTGFAYENLEQDPKKLVFEFRNTEQVLFITFKIKGDKIVSTWKFEEVAPVADSTPTVEELEERINDLPVAAKKGRGYANAGKKYGHSGVRVEEFKIGKEKVKKGDKLFFKVGKAEVCGIFSHLNKCVHCPEGYAVIRFEGKNFERRQSRVSLSASVAE